jgi:short-subunit dehydrogenase
MTQSLFGKNILITGSSRGIGKEIALTLAAAGANLILAARHELELEDVALKCEKLGVTAYPYKTDITDLDEVNNLFEFALESLGKIDIWINNVVVGASGEFLKTPMALHTKIIQTNLVGCMNNAYVALPYFQSRGQGVLINHIPPDTYGPHAVAYETSKIGLEKFIEVLQSEIKKQNKIFICEATSIETVLELCKNPHYRTEVESSGTIARFLDHLFSKVMQVYLKRVEKAQTELEPRRWRNFHPLRLFFRH